ncbi:hypothetical protein EVAR_25305_1 [Eumeta japonica]|uniref:Uncharacterized protein n=1 Tax=Eumeta variegata TaxID=151549 RepID=A0A4C1VPW9_EUMVA|nr:hypothetical protein EVAR_25305_1 [Eumeta japonica]
MIISALRRHQQRAPRLSRRVTSNDKRQAVSDSGDCDVGKSEYVSRNPRLKRGRRVRATKGGTPPGVLSNSASENVYE